MQKDNPITLKHRLKELFIDWLVISLYLAGLFAVAAMWYTWLWGDVPRFSEAQNQLIATFTSVVPIVALFSYLDSRGGSIGKRAAKLTIYFTNGPLVSSFIRNTIKFLPWQIGHMAVIHGMFTDFDTVSVALMLVSCGLFLVMFYMGIARRDKRHLGDILAGTQVQMRK